MVQVLGQLISTDNMQTDYETMTTNLLDWIKAKIRELNDHSFPNNTEGLQVEMTRFKTYITTEKPPKYVVIRTVVSTHMLTNSSS